ncbi:MULTISPECIES: PfkB family carbohydrate kinase [unclassified Burkholderia]|uniref:carbohydrate kinase family protein n=1 Tax=unclassified Burkholderia TaxID=2613784 RepID=UPI00075C41C4|nr:MULTISPECIES: PfkB family carbohydrate kinase [unclassified Burkholderia]KVN03123.1 carbohydrate kinase [Burkholderia sp. MSMB1552]KWZ49782.1 carbohydrate kinase [Burkholderia sp. MSMB1588]
MASLARTCASRGACAGKADPRGLRATLPRVAQQAGVLVVGSLNIDLLLYSDASPSEGDSLPVRAIALPGGHAGNCASALAALGLAVSIVAALGDDADGDRLLTDLDARGIDTRFVRRVAHAHTGRAIIPVLGPERRNYMLLDRGANESLAAADVRAALSGVARCDALMLFDPSADALAQTFALARAHHPAAALCWTPSGMYSRDPVALPLLPQCDVVFANAREFAHLREQDDRVLDALDGVDVVVTLGERGALSRHRGVETRAPAHPCEVVDPTGAGDAFASAYLLARLAGLDAADRLRLGNAGGACAVGTRGARDGLPTLDALLDAALDSPQGRSAPPRAEEPAHAHAAKR